MRKLNDNVATLQHCTGTQNISGRYQSKRTGDALPQSRQMLLPAHQAQLIVAPALWVGHCIPLLPAPLLVSP
jgi:hypothetical protein